MFEIIRHLSKVFRYNLKYTTPIFFGLWSSFTSQTDTDDIHTLFYTTFLGDWTSGTVDLPLWTNSLFYGSWFQWIRSNFVAFSIRLGRYTAATHVLLWGWRAVRCSGGPGGWEDSAFVASDLNDVDIFYHILTNRHEYLRSKMWAIRISVPWVFSKWGICSTVSCRLWWNMMVVDLGTY